MVCFLNYSFKTFWSSQRMAHTAVNCQGLNTISNVHKYINILAKCLLWIIIPQSIPPKSEKVYRVICVFQPYPLAVKYTWWKQGQTVNFLNWTFAMKRLSDSPVCSVFLGPRWPQTRIWSGRSVSLMMRCLVCSPWRAVIRSSSGPEHLRALPTGWTWDCESCASSLSLSNTVEDCYTSVNCSEDQCTIQDLS